MLRALHAPSFSSAERLEPLRDPDLDDRLSRHAEAIGLVVERLDHPEREIDVDALVRTIGTRRRCEIEFVDDVFDAFVKLPIQFTGLRMPRPPEPAISSRRSDESSLHGR